MAKKFVWRGLLIAALSAALATPARADQLQTDATEIVIGIVVVSAAVAVLVTVLILRHKPKKSAITGCVNSGANGMSVTDEKDKRNYALSGNTVGVKPGDRMTLQGKPKNPGKTLVLEVQKVTQDFGACQP